MKKVKYLLLLVAMLVLPFTVFAQEETTAAAENSKVKVVFFRGEGCSHCAEAIEWFNSIQESYGSKFEIDDYETWYDADNSKLMNEVAALRGEEETATGVPYIIIGDKSWVGFSEYMKDEILAQIDSLYEVADDERYDVLELLGESTTNVKSTGKDILSLVIILIIVGGAAFGVYKARETNK